MGLSGRVPKRVDAATKAALMDLIGRATDAGWSTAQACRYLELPQRRLQRWRNRLADGDSLDDGRPGGNPVHGLTPAEEDEIVAVFGEWADIDRSHRKLAHRGWWLGRFWADPSTVRRVLERRDLRFRRPRRPGRSHRKPWPGSVEEKPNRVWIYDATHWKASGAASVMITDVVSRRWISDLTSTGETSIQVQAAFTQGLREEGLLEVIEARSPDGSVPYDPEDDRLPVLLVMSDNGPQNGRPGIPTDQAWIESFFGHLKTEFPHLDLIEDLDVLRAELEIRRDHYNGMRLHAGIGYVTPDQEHRGQGPAVRAARKKGLARAQKRRINYHHNNHTPEP